MTSVYCPELSRSVPAWVIANIEQAKLWCKSQGLSEWEFLGVGNLDTWKLRVAGHEKRAAEAAETITTLRAKLEAAERDAARYRQDSARYRHLRDWSRADMCVRQRQSYDSFTWLSGASLDHATDAAIAAIDAAANQGESNDRD